MALPPVATQNGLLLTNQLGLIFGLHGQPKKHQDLKDTSPYKNRSTDLPSWVVAHIG